MNKTLLAILVTLAVIATIGTASALSITISPTGEVVIKNGDSITVSATAEDSKGVNDISLYVDGNLVASNRCGFCEVKSLEKCGWVDVTKKKCGHVIEEVCKERYKCWNETKQECRKECKEKYVCDKVYKYTCEWKTKWVKRKRWVCTPKLVCDFSGEYIKCKKKLVCGWKKQWVKIRKRECGYKWVDSCNWKWVCEDVCYDKVEKVCGWKWTCEEEEVYKCWNETVKEYKCWNENVKVCQYPDTCSVKATLKLSQGTHKLCAVASDKNGVISTKRESLRVVIDQHPSVSITPPSGTFKAKGKYYTGTFTASATDDVGLKSVKMYLDGKLQASKDCSCPWWNPLCDSKKCSLSYTLSIPPGKHTIKAVAIDTSGQTASKQYTVAVEEDYPPTVSLSPPGGTFKTGSNGKWTGTVSASAFDDRKIVWMKIFVDGKLYKSRICNSKSCTLAAKLELKPGNHKVTAAAYDDGWNYVSKDYTFVIKDNPPTVSLSPPGGTFKMNKKVDSITKSFTASATDDVGVDSIKMYLDGKLQSSKSCKPAWWCWWCAPSKSCSVSKSLELTVGKHVIKVVAKDNSRHTTVKMWTVELIVDLSPEVGMSPPGGEFTAEDLPYSFKFTAWANDDKGLYALKVYADGKLVKFEKCRGATSYVAVGAVLFSSGKHTVKVVAVDTSGNVAGQSYSVSVDAKPKITLTAPKTAKTDEDYAEVAVKAAASDDVAVKKLTLYIDGEAKASCSGKTCEISKTFKLEAGRHTITATAVDSAGHEASESTTVDVVGAAVELTLGAPVKTETKTALVPFFAKELPATVVIKKIPEDANVQISADGKALVRKTCSGSICEYTVKVPLDKLENKVGELKEIELEITVDYGSFKTVKKQKIKVARSASFVPNSEITIYVTFDKGLGRVTSLNLTYGGKVYKPASWPSALNSEGSRIVAVPFKIRVSKSDYVILKVCNAAGCDEKKLRIYAGNVEIPSVLVEETEIPACMPSVEIETAEPAACYPPDFDMPIVLSYSASDSGAGECGLARAELYVDGKPISTALLSGTSVEGSFTIVPSDFGAGPHVAKVVVENTAGVKAEDTWTFEVCSITSGSLKKAISIYAVEDYTGVEHFVGKDEVTNKYYEFGYFKASTMTGVLYADPIEPGFNVMQMIKVKKLEDWPEVGYYEYTKPNINDGTTHITEQPYCDYGYNEQPGGSYMVECKWT